MSDSENIAAKGNLKRALCYIFVVPLIFSVIEKNNKELEMDIRYGSMIFVWWIILSLIGWILNVWMLVFLFYVTGSWFLAFKAYNNEKIQLDVLDQAYEAMVGKMKK